MEHGTEYIFGSSRVGGLALVIREHFPGTWRWHFFSIFGGNKHVASATWLSAGHQSVGQKVAKSVNKKILPIAEFEISQLVNRWLFPDQNRGGYVL